MKRVGIIFNSEKPKAQAEVRLLKDWLTQRKCSVVVLPSHVKKMPRLDFALSLGGDGTMLKASKYLAPARVPVLGINLGSLGFLAETDPVEAYAFLENILEHGFTVEERTMLSVTLVNGKRRTVRIALNDCIVHSGNNGRIIDVNVAINGEFLGNYFGDGLIVATPTGSTAYSLAASGPIVHPHLSLLILTPICPHTLAQRPMIVSDQHELTITASSYTAKEKPILSLDGQTNFRLDPDDTVTITAAKHPLRLIVNPRRRYLQVLRTKLKWGERG